MDIEKTEQVLDGKSWEKDLPECDDLEVLVAPWENSAFEKETQKLIRALPPALRIDGQVEPGSWYIIVGKAIARTVIFGWKNFQLGGADKPFDKAYAESVLVDRKYRIVRDGIIAAAKRVQLGLKAEEDAVLGNSAGSSNGSETSAATTTG